MKNYISILVILLAVLSSCEETVTLDADQTEPRVIIEGLITDQERHHYVKVSQSTGFYEQTGFNGKTDAIVTVEDDAGNLYTYSHYSPETKGLYLSDEQFAGEIGRTYTLTVTLGSEVYKAEDKIYPVTKIDSLEVTINEEEFEDPEDAGYFYEVLFYAKEPQATEDYYLFKFYRNDSLVQDSETDIYYADDELIAENIDGVATAGYYKKGDRGRVEMYSISRRAFVYYNDLATLLNGDGGMFSPPPANPRSNLSNDALGYFQTSAIAVDTVLIE